MRTATATLGVDVGRVLALDGAGERLSPVATRRHARRTCPARARRCRSACSDTAGALHTLRTGEPTITADMAAETRFEPSPTLLKLGILSSLSVAIEGHDEPFGVLNVSAREPHVFSEDEVAFLAAVATLIIIAVERDRGEQVTRHAALHDPLTGLPNRTLALDRLEQALARRQRERIDLAVFVLDVDGFKLINDSLGHAAGDEVLLALAPRLTAALRTTDTVARLGGDEFVVICPDVDGPRGATDVAERLGAAVTRPLSLEQRRALLHRQHRRHARRDEARHAGVAARRRRRRDVPGQGPRPRRLRAVRRGDAHQPDGARAHRDRAAARAQRRRARSSTTSR